MVDFADIALSLNVGASVAIVITAILVILQLRQNARLIEHAARESRSNVALTIL